MTNDQIADVFDQIAYELKRKEGQLAKSKDPQQAALLTAH